MGYYFQICASFKQICSVWIKLNKPVTAQELIVSVADRRTSWYSGQWTLSQLQRSCIQILQSPNSYWTSFLSKNASAWGYDEKRWECA